MKTSFFRHMFKRGKQFDAESISIDDSIKNTSAFYTFYQEFEKYLLTELVDGPSLQLVMHNWQKVPRSQKIKFGEKLIDQMCEAFQKIAKNEFEMDIQKVNVAMLAHKTGSESALKSTYHPLSRKITFYFPSPTGYDAFYNFCQILHHEFMHVMQHDLVEAMHNKNEELMLDHAMVDDLKAIDHNLKNYQAGYHFNNSMRDYWQGANYRTQLVEAQANWGLKSLRKLLNTANQTQINNSMNTKATPARSHETNRFVIRAPETLSPGERPELQNIARKQTVIPFVTRVRPRPTSSLHSHAIMAKYGGQRI